MLQAELQQTPWAQNPLWHWLFAVQGEGIGFLPHELTTPPIPQLFGATHCVSSVQAV